MSHNLERAGRDSFVNRGMYGCCADRDIDSRARFVGYSAVSRSFDRTGADTDDRSNACQDDAAGADAGKYF